MKVWVELLQAHQKHHINCGESDAYHKKEESCEPKAKVFHLVSKLRDLVSQCRMRHSHKQGDDRYSRAKTEYQGADQCDFGILHPLMIKVPAIAREAARRHQKCAPIEI